MEILVLRHQVAVLRRQMTRPALQPADRMLRAVLSRMLPRPRWSVFLVTRPRYFGGIVNWSRRWTYPNPQPGRPPARTGIY